MTIKPTLTIDRDRAIRAYRNFLWALGYDFLKLPSMNAEASGKDTAERAVDAMIEFLTKGQEHLHFTCFPWDGEPEMIAVTHLRFESLCAHHMLLYTGVAHIGYIPKATVCGLSKIARVVTHYSRRPSIQENLTAKIATFLEEQLQPMGVGVIIEATHGCMSARGVSMPSHVTVTSTMRGVFETATVRGEFWRLIQAAKGSRPGGD